MKEAIEEKLFQVGAIKPGCDFGTIHASTLERSIIGDLDAADPFHDQHAPG